MTGTVTTRTNKFATDCATCNTRVAAGAGHLIRAEDGWITRCTDCDNLTPEQRDAKIEAAESSRSAQVAAETAYLESQGYGLFDAGDTLHAALLAGGFTSPVSVAAPKPAAAPVKRRSPATTSRRRKACVTGGNCSSTTGVSCGGHNCDANAG